MDACLNLYDVGVIMSNDSDLVMAASLVKQHCKKVIGIINPKRDKPMAAELKKIADFTLDIRLNQLAASQLPESIHQNGKQIEKPKSWGVA